MHYSLQVKLYRTIMYSKIHWQKLFYVIADSVSEHYLIILWNIYQIEYLMTCCTMRTCKYNNYYTSYTQTY